MGTWGQDCLCEAVHVLDVNLISYCLLTGVLWTVGLLFVVFLLVDQQWHKVSSMFGHISNLKWWCSVVCLSKGPKELHLSPVKMLRLFSQRRVWGHRPEDKCSDTLLHFVVLCGRNYLIRVSLSCEDSRLQCCFNSLKCYSENMCSKNLIFSEAESWDGCGWESVLEWTVDKLMLQCWEASLSKVQWSHYKLLKLLTLGVMMMIDSQQVLMSWALL